MPHSRSALRDLGRSAELAVHDRGLPASSRNFRAAMSVWSAYLRSALIISSRAWIGMEISVARLSWGIKTISRNAFRYVILSAVTRSR